MQQNNNYIPMVQDYIREKMPNGGYGIVSLRLQRKGVTATKTDVWAAVKTLKNIPETEIIKECVLFLKDSNLPLNEHCEDFIRKENEK